MFPSILAISSDPDLHRSRRLGTVEASTPLTQARLNTGLRWCGIAKTKREIMTAAIRVEHAYKVFGRREQEVVRRLEAGESREDAAAPPGGDEDDAVPDETVADCGDRGR